MAILRTNRGFVENSNGIQVIARAAAILRALEGETEGMIIPDIAREVALPASTVQRIVKALVVEGLVASAGPRAGFRIGPALMRLGATAATDVIAKINPYLRSLSAALKETVDLSALSNDAALFVDQVVGPARLTAVSAVGERFPLHCTANGKILLASLPPARREMLLPQHLTAYTAATIIDRARLEEEIAGVQMRKLASDAQEHTDGIAAIAVGLTDAMGRTYAISVPVPIQRFLAKQRTIEKLLVEARDTIVAAIGGAASP